MTAWELATSSWGPEEIKAIQEVIADDRYTMGAKVKAFEEAFAAYHGRGHAVMVNSGSSANLVAVAAQAFKKDRPIERGDEVIVPAVSWSTMYHPLQQYGLKMKVVDVELDSLNIDVEKMEAALTPKTRMVAAVSILGNPAALDRIRAFCDAHDLILFEDNCESLDAEMPGGRKTGTFGHVATNSFFFSHHIATMEGGMAMTDDLETDHLMRSLRAHGWTRDLPTDSPVFESKGNDRFEAYRFILPGYNVRPIEMAGAIGLEQLKKMPAMTDIRHANWQHFQKLFSTDERFIIQRENGRSSCFSFTIILNPELNIDRDKVFGALEEANIGYRIITGGCILRHDVTRYYDMELVGEIKNAFIAHDHGFFVGNHPRDLRNDITRLYDILTKSC